MNKRFFLPVTLLTCHLLSNMVHAIGFEDLSDLFEEMHQMHRNMEQRMLKLFEEPEESSNKQKAATSIKIEEVADKNSIIISLNGVVPKNEKPDASLNMDQLQEKIELEVPLLNGKVDVNYQKSLMTVRFVQQGTEEKKNEQGTHEQRFARVYNQGQFIRLKPDFSKMPKISYDKGSKTMTITIAADDTAASNHMKTVVPIEIK